MASKKAPAPAVSNQKTSKYASLNLNSLHKPVAAPVVAATAKPAQKGLIVLGVPGKDKKAANSKLFEPPKPVQLGSLKAENRGLNPTINLVPAGGLGWGKKADTTPKASPEITSKAEPSAPPKLSMPKAAVPARTESKGDADKEKPSDASRESDTPKAQSPSWVGWGKTPKAGSGGSGKRLEKDFPTLSSGEAAASNASAMPTSMATSAPSKSRHEDSDVEEAPRREEPATRPQARTETGGARPSTLRRGASWADQAGGDDSDHSSGRGRGSGGGRGSAGSDASDGAVKETRSRPSKASRSEAREKRRKDSKEDVDEPSAGKSSASAAKAGPPSGNGSSGDKEDVAPADQRAWMREAALRRAAERRKEEDAILAEQRARAAEKLRALDERAAEKKRQKEAEAKVDKGPTKVEAKPQAEPKEEPREETKALNGPTLKSPILKDHVEEKKPEPEVSSRAPPSMSGQRNGTQGRGWHTSSEDSATAKPVEAAAVATPVSEPASVPLSTASRPHSNEDVPAGPRSEPQSVAKSVDASDEASVPATAASAEPAEADASEVPKWQKPAKPTRGDGDSDWRRRDDQYWKRREAAPAEESQADHVRSDDAAPARRTSADDQATAEKPKEQRPPAPTQARAGQAATQARAGAASSQVRAGPGASAQPSAGQATKARAGQSAAEKAKEQKPLAMLQQSAAIEPSTEPAARAAARAVERAGGSVWAARAEAQALIEAAKLKEEEEKKKAEEEAAAARAKAAEEERAKAAEERRRAKEARWQEDSGAGDEDGGKGKGKGKGRKAKGKGTYAADGDAEAQGDAEDVGRPKGRSKGEKGSKAEKSGKAEKGAGKAEKGAGKAEKGSAKGKGKGKAKAAWDGEDEAEGKGKGKKGRQRWVVKDAQESWYSKYDDEDYSWESKWDSKWDSKWARRKGGEATSSTAPADTSAVEIADSADAEAQEQATPEARETRPSRAQRHGEQSTSQRTPASAREEKGHHEVQEKLPERPEPASGAAATTERRAGTGGSGAEKSGSERKRDVQTKPAAAREGRDGGRDVGRGGARDTSRSTAAAASGQEVQAPPRRPPPQPPSEPQKPKEADRRLVNTLHDIGDSGFSVGAGVVCVPGDTTADAGEDAEGDDEFQTVKSKKQQKAEKAEKKRLAEEEAKKEAKREAKRSKRREAAGGSAEEAAVPAKASQEPSEDPGVHAALPQDEASALRVNAPAASRQAPSASNAMPSTVRGEVSEQSNESAGGASGSGSPAIGPLHMSGGFPSFGPFGAIGSLSAQPSKEIAAIWERPTAAPGFRAPPPFPVGPPSQPSTSSGGRPLRPVGRPPPYAPPAPTRPLLRRQALQWAARQAGATLDAEASVTATSTTAPANAAKQDQADFAPSSSSRRPKETYAPPSDSAARSGGRGSRGRGGRGRGTNAEDPAREAPSLREDAEDAPQGRSFYSDKGGKRSKGRARGDKGGEKGAASAGKRESYYAAHGEMGGGRPRRDTSANEAATPSAQGKASSGSAASRSGDGQRGRGRGKGGWRDAEPEQQPRGDGSQRSGQARSSGGAADRAEEAPRSRGRGKGRGRSQGDTTYTENPRVNGTSSTGAGSAAVERESRGQGSGRGGRRGGGKMMYKPKAASTS